MTEMPGPGSDKPADRESGSDSDGSPPDILVNNRGKHEDTDATDILDQRPAARRSKSKSKFPRGAEETKIVYLADSH